ncbi:uncharacterized protein A4U43_C04F16840 [Asparagus officinalis]|uniref:C2H2-type domain-containing protein n=1 Tax=Asparagus officinalis TaxID=4686 RepID=A0A5P1F388_ASPOF|nr:zinc finger protein 11 [Asparagus officinalis]ONK72203.1 uncharacterized protein A4U43_C04F16840 [Asparagus officinalis]
MAAELGLFSLTQLQNLAQQQQQQQRRPANEEDDSWEVRAFAEDTSSSMGTTWPPRSYTCNFCRREFRSAQALGGHMNVHRRDRARLRQPPQVPEPPPVMIPSGEFVANGGLCLFYPVPNSSSTFLSVSAYEQAVNLPTSSMNLGESLLGKVGMVRDASEGRDASSNDDGGIVEELDLELRLGW